jgi:hypothetical protein
VPSHLTIHNGLTGGSLLGFAAITAPAPINSGDTRSYAVGAVTIGIN